MYICVPCLLEAIQPRYAALFHRIIRTCGMCQINRDCLEVPAEYLIADSEKITIDTDLEKSSKSISNAMTGSVIANQQLRVRNPAIEQYQNEWYRKIIFQLKKRCVKWKSIALFSIGYMLIDLLFHFIKH